jgi:dTDP-4-amino-4,6-dideoxygalactose transaminase
VLPTRKGRGVVLAATELKREIPFFDYRRAFLRTEEEFVSIFRDVLHRGAFIMQKDLAEFERHLAEFLGVKYAFGVAWV